MPNMQKNQSQAADYPFSDQNIEKELKGKNGTFGIHRGAAGTLIEKMYLENGLTLEMFDNSRPIAGDRWQVSFEARIEVEVEPESFQDQASTDVPFEDISALVGEKVCYRCEKVRNFITENKKDEVLTGMKERFLSTSLGYLSGPGFRRKLILRTYQNMISPTRVWERQ